MPRISYYCSECLKTLKKFYKTSKEIEDKRECECGGELVRQLSSPSQKSTMVMDNGLQAKAVEVNRDIVEIIEDREESQTKRRGDSVLEELK
jgi:hypothetical protein